MWKSSRESRPSIIFNETPPENLPFWKKRRYLIVFLAFFGYFNVFAMRTNLSIAILKMTEFKNVTLSNSTVTQVQEFEWDPFVQGIVLSSFYWGYTLTQIFGGYFGFRFGGHRMFFLGVFFKSILTIVTPPIAKIHLYAFIGLRVFEGLFEGLTIPCMPDVWRFWSPPMERTRMISFALSGSFVGAAVTFPVSGALAASFGWESVFYFFGVLALVWSLIWAAIVKRSPTRDKRISVIERSYITRSLNADQVMPSLRYRDVPWAKMWLSLPVWAIIVADFAENWGFITLLTQLPRFIEDVFKFKLFTSSAVSSLPYITMTVSTFTAAYIADMLQVKGVLSTTGVRKLFNTTSFLGQTIFLAICGYLSHRFYSIIALSVGVFVGAFSMSGYVVNNLDIAPNYASIVFGMSNFFGGISGSIAPIIAGFVAKDKTRESWQQVFFIAAAIYLAAGTFFLIFSSGNVQPWALMQPQNQNKSTEDEETEDDKI